MIVNCPNGHSVTVAEGVLQTCHRCGTDFRVCPLGHPAEPEARLCPTCGSTLKGGTPREAPTSSHQPSPAILPIAPLAPKPDHPDRRVATSALSPTPAPQPLSSLAPSAPSKNRSKVIAAIAAAAVLVLALVVIFAITRGHNAPAHLASKNVHSRSHNSNTSPAVSTPATSQATTPTTSTPQTEADQLSGLLTQSESDRAAIVAAVRDISNCGDLQNDQTTLDTSANNRQSLLSTLRGDTFSALPQGNPLVLYLIGSWDYSIASDQSYAQWAGDEMENGCTNGDTSDSNFENAQITDGESTNAKQHFVALWNPIATTYDLPTVTPLSF
jgi:hypothetical protein